MKITTILLSVLLVAVDVIAQNASPVFEVAVIKENKSGSQNSSNRTAETATVRRM